jgi:GTPase SAR1 family protein
VVGSSCGKTSLCIRLIQNEFIAGEDPTIQTFYSYGWSFFSISFTLLHLFKPTALSFRVKMSKLDPNNQKFKDSNLIIMDTSGSDVYYDLHQEVCDKIRTKNREYLIVLNCLVQGNSFLLILVVVFVG